MTGTITFKEDQLYIDTKVARLYKDQNQDKGKSVMGSKLEALMGHLGPLGDEDLCKYLIKNPQCIPQQWKKEGRRIFFWGGADGRKGIPYLTWNEDGNLQHGTEQTYYFCEGVGIVEAYWGADDPAVILRYK